VLLALLRPAAGLACQNVENVIVVSLDGFRWQELFAGAQRELIGRTGGVRDTSETLARFWRDDPAQRRALLMPFFWSEVAVRGQVYGDSARGSITRVTNGLRFSYPGYNEMLAGVADARISSNDKVLNPNVTVLEYLNDMPAYDGRVAAFGSWDVLPFILDTARSGLPANGAGDPFPQPAGERERLINELSRDVVPAFGPCCRLDAATMEGAIEYLRTRQPRVLYVMLGETDEWAHNRRYDLYLDAAWRSDRFLRRLWETAQSLEQHRGRTALVITTDHGRGSAADWTDHGRDTPAAERIWIAVMGPGTPALGVRTNSPATQSQVAATIAALLGENFASRPGVAPPLPNLR